MHLNHHFTSFALAADGIQPVVDAEPSTRGERSTRGGMRAGGHTAGAQASPIIDPHVAYLKVRAMCVYVPIHSTLSILSDSVPSRSHRLSHKAVHTRSVCRRWS